jgi:hypothetical protein
LARLPRRWLTYLQIDGVLSSVPKGTLSTEWLDFLDWLGREGVSLSVDSPRRELADELVRQFCCSPEGRRGLLPIIAEFTAAGCTCQVPQHILDLAKTWSPRAVDDAVGLGLVTDTLSEAEIVASANEISRSSSLHAAVWRALRMAAGSSSRRAAEFALALLAVLSDSSEAGAGGIDHARRILSEFLTNRPSLLQDPAVWKRLNLPARV